jgi:C-terminal processing protease CtpA/Prc
VPPLAESESAIAEAFAYLRATAALILDVRANGGGYPDTVARYVSYLSESPPFVVNTFQWRKGARQEFRTTDLGARSYGSKKPVYVLTSRQTFSGGEELAYDLQALKRAVLVGETTGGGADPGGMQPVGHDFDVVMPKGRAVNPITGTNWEGTGIKPDIEVPPDQALTKAHRAALVRLQALGGATPFSGSTNGAGRLK